MEPIDYTALYEQNEDFNRIINISTKKSQGQENTVNFRMPPLTLA